MERYIPPSLQPVLLSTEEQEELRKKEERKDRLHQNYLKRKASGAQKWYEDKIKAKKKAEMDAKKALIRGMLCTDLIARLAACNFFRSGF